MNHMTTSLRTEPTETAKDKSATGGHTTKGELVVKGVATAVAAATIIEVGKVAVTALSRQPLLMFGFGIAAGVLTQKYRNEIVLVTGKTAEQSKDFLLKQKDHIKDLIAECRQEGEDRDLTD